MNLPVHHGGSRPKLSITSTSPQPGQGTFSMFAPSIQNAGRIPCPRCIFIRAATRRIARLVTDIDGLLEM
jgi:hypothetical protein